MSPDELKAIADRAHVTLSTMDASLMTDEINKQDVPIWTAGDRARMCGCGHPEQHTDDRTEQW